jgi:hypothetical protein
MTFSTLGICQLLASERPSLQNLHVKGDIIVKPETRDGKRICCGVHAIITDGSYSAQVIVTRSKAKKSMLIRTFAEVQNTEKVLFEQRRMSSPRFRSQ